MPKAVAVSVITASCGFAALALSSPVRLLGGGAHSPLLGPMLLVADTAPQNRLAGACSTVLLLAALLAPLIRAHWATVALALGAAAIWLFIGVAASGISC